MAIELDPSGDRSSCLAGQHSPPVTHDVDIAIVGAGLSGSIVALTLARAGFRVAVVDRYELYPKEFRVEKIGGNQIDLIRRLGMLENLASVSTRFDQVVNAKHGRIIDKTNSPHYGIQYHDFVNAIRAKLDGDVVFLVDHAQDVQGDHEYQTVRLKSGAELKARLVVLATGMTDLLRCKLGVVRRTVFEKHSISFGCDLIPPPGTTFGFPALTYYGNQLSDRIDYLSIFPIRDVMRANLFTFRDDRDEWLRALRQQPEATLVQTLPGLEQFLGAFRVQGRVQNWTMNLYRLENYIRPGVVFIGDAFQTSCPAAGTGVSRLLTDVHQLCLEHIPRWFATRGMGEEKISEFYSDSEKQRSDRHSSRLADYRRSLTIDDGWRWQAHRSCAYVRRRMVGWVKDGTLRQAPFLAPRPSLGGSS